MRKYLVKALVTEYELDFEKNLYYPIKYGGYETEEIFAKDEDEAIKLFIERMDYKFDSAVECDDFTWEDLGPANVYIDSNPYNETNKGSYDPDVVDTMTVGELIEFLKEFDKDAKVILRNEDAFWNTFRGITKADIAD